MIERVISFLKYGGQIARERESGGKFIVPTISGVGLGTAFDALKDEPFGFLRFDSTNLSELSKFCTQNGDTTGSNFDYFLCISF